MFVLVACRASDSSVFLYRDVAGKSVGNGVSTSARENFSSSSCEREVKMLLIFLLLPSPAFGAENIYSVVLLGR